MSTRKFTNAYRQWEQQGKGWEYDLDRLKAEEAGAEDWLERKQNWKNLSQDAIKVIEIVLNPHSDKKRSEIVWVSNPELINEERLKIYLHKVLDWRWKVINRTMAELKAFARSL